jgi:hypothetical protein
MGNLLAVASANLKQVIRQFNCVASRMAVKPNPLYLFAVVGGHSHNPGHHYPLNNYNLLQVYSYTAALCSQLQARNLRYC